MITAYFLVTKHSNIILSIFTHGVIHKGCPHNFSDFWRGLPPCPHLSVFGWPPPSPVHPDTNFEYDKNFPAKIKPLPCTNTKKVSHKVKYLLTTLMQDENRERINIDLKITYGNRQKKCICFKKPIYGPVWTHQRTLLALINMDFQVLGNSIKIWDIWSW